MVGKKMSQPHAKKRPLHSALAGGWRNESISWVIHQAPNIYVSSDPSKMLQVWQLQALSLISISWNTDMPILIVHLTKALSRWQGH